MTQPDPHPQNPSKPDPVKIHASGRFPKSDIAFRVHEQQQRQNRRIGWIIIGSVVLATAFLVFIILWSQYSDDKADSQRWERLQQRIDAGCAEIDANNGYDRSRAVLKVVDVCQEALYDMAKTERQKSHWFNEINRFANVLDSESPTPQTGTPFVCPAGLIDMAYIPPGRFAMGKRSLEPGPDAELPRHEVEITRGFWMGRTEISFAQWWHIGDYAFFVKEYQHLRVTWRNYPVCMISWHHAMTYCQHLTERENARGRIPDGYEYRLPTEAEWEYACRAGTTTYYPWDTDTFLPLGTQYANVMDRVAVRKIDDVTRPHYPPGDGGILAWPVGKGAPNAFGLHDMIGNVDEWCYDWFNPSYRSLMDKPDPVQDVPVVVKFTQRNVYTEHYTLDATAVIRGGSWGKLPPKCRSASRDFIPPNSTNLSIGFRVVLAPKINRRQGASATEITLDSAPQSDLQTRTHSTEGRLPDMRDIPPESGPIIP